MSNTYTEQQAREELAAVHRLTVMENLHEGSWNHCSFEHPEHPEQIMLTPGHIPLERGLRQQPGGDGSTTRDDFRRPRAKQCRLDNPLSHSTGHDPISSA